MRTASPHTQTLVVPRASRLCHAPVKDVPHSGQSGFGRVVFRPSPKATALPSIPESTAWLSPASGQENRRQGRLLVSFFLNVKFTNRIRETLLREQRRPWPWIARFCGDFGVGPSIVHAASLGYHYPNLNRRFCDYELLRNLHKTPDCHQPFDAGHCHVWRNRLLGFAGE